MNIAKAVRHKNLDGLPEEFVTAITESFFRLCVHQDDLPLVVDHHHGIGSSLDRQAKTLLALPALGDVNARPYVPGKAPIRLGPRNANIQNPPICVIAAL